MSMMKLPSALQLCSRKIKVYRYCAARQINVHEGDRKRGYEHKFEKQSKLKAAQIGIKSLPMELGKFGREVKDHFTPQYWQMEHGDYKYQWKLNTQQAIDEWVVSTDRDMDSGSSWAKTSLSKQECMLFHGFLDTTVPDDGKTQYAGYVNARSPYNMKSFGRVVPYDWLRFTHLVIRCRGDGRPYSLNVHMENYFDITWHDIYSFILFTRGGPYWQIAKIPFSKFLLVSKGRIQDKQELIHLDRVRNLAFTLSDDAQGPFQLEVDYVGLVYDAYHTHKFFYEMYDGDPLMS